MGKRWPFGAESNWFHLTNNNLLHPYTTLRGEIRGLVKLMAFTFKWLSMVCIDQHPRKYIFNIDHTITKSRTILRIYQSFHFLASSSKKLLFYYFPQKTFWSIVTNVNPRERANQINFQFGFVVQKRLNGKFALH